MPILGLEDESEPEHAEDHQKTKSLDRHEGLPRTERNVEVRRDLFSVWTAQLRSRFSGHFGPIDFTGQVAIDRNKMERDVRKEDYERMSGHRFNEDGVCVYCGCATRWGDVGKERFGQEGYREKAMSPDALPEIVPPKLPKEFFTGPQVALYIGAVQTWCVTREDFIVECIMES
jgi:hypothetical protein